MSRREAALSLVCDQRDRIPMLLAVLIAMGILLAFSFLFLQPGTPSYAIAVLDAFLIVGALVSFGGVFWYCTKREMIEYE